MNPGNGKTLTYSLAAIVLVAAVFLTIKGLNRAEAELPTASARKKATATEAEFIASMKSAPLAVKDLLLQHPLSTISDTGIMRSIAVKASDSLFFGIAGFYLKKLAGVSGRDVDYYDAGRYLVFEGSNQGNDGYYDLLWQSADACLDSALARNPMNLAARNAKVICIANYENDAMKGVMYLRKTLELDSNNVEAHFIYARLLMESGQTDKAVLRFKKLISLQPQNPSHYFALSEIYARQGQKELAKEYLDKGKKLNK